MQPITSKQFYSHCKCKPNRSLQTIHNCMVSTNSFPPDLCLWVTYTSSPEAQEVSASDSGVSACNFQSKTTESLHQGFITGGLVINGRFDVKRILQMYTSRLQAGGCPTGILNYIQDLWGEVFQWQNHVICTRTLRESLTKEPFREGKEESDMAG